jgi:transcriptional regulator with XRE-family HTH domain
METNKKQRNSFKGIKEGIGLRISMVREEKNLTQEYFGSRLDVSGTHISQLETGGKRPSPNLIWRICFEFAINPRWLQFGEEPRELPKDFTQLDSLVKEDPNARAALFVLKSWAMEGVARQSAGAPGIDWGELQVPGQDLEAFYVPSYDVVASTGAHNELLEQIVDYLAFKREWLRQFYSGNPRHLALILARGDSMHPTIQDGDLLLIDLSQHQITTDAIYVLRLDEQFLIAKRVQRMYDGTIHVLSDNAAYATQIVQASDIHVVGRVIWYGRRL